MLRRIFEEWKNQTGPEQAEEKVGWGGWTRTNTVLINSEVPYRLDHAPAASQRQTNP
jgi:hypothetical protein